MAKKSKHPRKIAQSHSQKANTDTFKIEEKKQDLIFIGIIVAILIYLFKPMVIDGLSPQGVDVVGSVGNSHQIAEWQKESGETALWNPYVFSGMPSYQRSSPVVYSVDTILYWLGGFTNNIFIYYLFGAIGLFLFLRYLKLSPTASFFGAILFILMPHFKSLYLEGHNTKVRALMILPWICFSFKYFLRKRSLLSAALFALAFGIQIRTQHYQIIFYSGLFIFALGVYPILKDLFEKSYKRFFNSMVLVFLAVTLAILTAAQPLFLAKEYLPWSKRGKTTIDISAPHKTKNIAKTDGVSIDYATSWSTAPSELITWAIPRSFGGMSSEKYTGDNVKQLKGKQIPGYWGQMPFTQSYEYMGAITLLLAVIGFFFNRKNKFIQSLALFAGFLTLLSFGRHALWFYGLFFDYVPFFNKFRAPMMSVTVTFFIFSIFAAYGLSAIKQRIENGDDFKANKPLFIILGSFLGFGLLTWLIGQGLSFTKPGGEPYNPQVMEIIISIRKEMFNSDILRYMALIAASTAAVFAYLKGKLNYLPLAFLIIVISIIDLVNIQTKVEKKFIDRSKIVNSYFQETSTDRAILQDKSLFRIYPMGQLYQDNRFAYYHQNIGGYSPIKMFTIEEFITNNLRGGTVANRNVMKILNVKYLITSQGLNDPDLQLINRDEGLSVNTYYYKNNLKRGFFVGKYSLIEDEFTRLREINNPDFDPSITAIVEEELASIINLPDSNSVEVIKFNPNQIHFNVYTDKQSLFVISELYYPPGWKILIDGQPVSKIYKTDHAIQSIIVPSGNHIVEVNFAPDSYVRNIQYAAGSMSLIMLLIIGSLVKLFLDKKRKLNNP